MIPVLPDYISLNDATVFSECTTHGSNNSILPTKPMKLVIANSHCFPCVGIHSMLAQQTDLQVIGAARDYATTVDLVRSLRPDVLILAVGADSLEVCEDLHRSGDLPRTILVSESIQAMDFNKFVSAGVMGFCLNVVDPVGLWLCLLTVNQGNYWIENRIAASLAFQASLLGESDSAPPVSVGCKQTDMDAFSSREIEILKMIASGFTNRQIASRLYLSISTVKTYVKRVLEKLQAEDRTRAAVLAIKNGLI